MCQRCWMVPLHACWPGDREVPICMHACMYGCCRQQHCSQLSTIVKRVCRSDTDGVTCCVSFACYHNNTLCSTILKALRGLTSRSSSLMRGRNHSLTANLASPVFLIDIEKAGPVTFGRSKSHTTIEFCEYVRHQATCCAPSAFCWE